jgi:hypothetical protein
LSEDDDDSVVNGNLTRGDEDMLEPDEPDPFCGVYANVPKEGHALKLVDNCEFYNAKKFEYEPSRFCCCSGAIHLSTPEMPSDELVQLWTASDSDARHFRDHIRYFNGHFSFTSLHCNLDGATTDTRKCPIYTFRVHGALYHNLKTFSKENKYEPNHLELYFYEDDPDLDYRLSKCREKTEQKDKEVIFTMVNIFNSGVNPYSDQLRTMGEVEDFSDYHIEFNLDQRLDHNKPLTLEVEGSEHQG